MANPWDEIFLDDFNSSYKTANENYLQSSQDFDLRARAISSFLLGDYNNALDDYILLNKNEVKTNRLSDGSCVGIALCYYALGDNEKAIEFFKFPVTNRREIQYTSDISVPASILFYISLKLNRGDILKIALKELNRLKTTVPKFLLGQISETALNEMFEQHTNEILRNRKQCKIEFYKAVAKLQSGDIGKYKMHLDNCVELKGKYLEFEYFIAKVERDKIDNS